MSTQSAEAYVTKRYRFWRTAAVDFDYKHRKGTRIAQIMRETGGLEPLVLELGVGPGGVAVSVSREGVRVVGIDISPDALDRAKEHCRLHQVRLLRASGFQLPFRDESFPLIYASQVLHLVDSAERLAMMQEAYRVLKPGGRFVFDMKNIWSHPLRFLRATAARRRTNFPSHSEVVALLRRCGFAGIIRRAGVLPFAHWAKVPNVALLRQVAHTTFFVAWRPEGSLRR